ncbi:MAG: hypothetical protein D6731_06710, partial [Planctomycetota bacterium]
MLSSARQRLTTPLVVGTALLTFGLTGCGGHKSKRPAAAGTTSGAATAGDDHGDDAASATALSAGAPLAGRIDSAGDADWFVVTLSAGQSYDFRTDALAGGMDTVLRLIDVDGTTVLAENDDGANNAPASELLGFAAPADGDYYLAVFHKDPTAASGSYEVGFDAAAAGGGTQPPGGGGTQPPGGGGTQPPG